MTIIAAIDPGKSGAVAFLIDGVPQIVEDMPVAGGMVSPVLLRSMLTDMDPHHVVIEQVASRPGQGVSSVFDFGRSYGIALGVCAQWPTTLVIPNTWKRHHRIPAKSDKEASRALALRLYPHLSDRLARKSDDGRAEAMLIGQWLHDTQHNNINESE